MAAFTLSFLALLSVASALPVNDINNGNSTSTYNGDTSYTLLYHNNLNTTDDANHISFILLDPQPKADGEASCATIGEVLLSKSTIEAYQDDIAKSLSYAQFSGSHSGGFWTSDGALNLSSNGQLDFFNAVDSDQLRPLCTNSFQTNDLSIPGRPNSSDIVTVESGSNNYLGFRNKKSFRFLGIPYADTPSRWQYSKPFSAVRETLDAYSYGAQCWQPGGNSSTDSEDCLFLNIQTPYIPSPGSKQDLRKVQFYIHGGGFTGGTGSDPALDGGDLVSREDVVAVTINYRLSTFGFLAIPGTDIKGNFGIADQINALEWVVKNIAAFGGDPNRITIAGGSAGAASVRALLGSPAAAGKFQGAIAGSNLGGGVALGLGGDAGTTFSSYLTIDKSYQVAGQQIFQGAGCTQTDLSSQVDCLKKVSASTIIGLPTLARFIVQDGTYVDTEELILNTRNGSTANVDVMMGNARNDGASYSNYPGVSVTSEIQGLTEGLGISSDEAQAVINSGLFPFYDSGNLTLDAFNVSQRIATDKTFRCIDQASAYAGATTGIFRSTWYYQTDRSENGYDPNNVGNPPATPGYPCGNPNLPYFRVHGSDVPWFFGGLACIRNEDDLFSIQESLAHVGAFIRAGDPNPPEQYLQARGYTQVLQAMQQQGPWRQVNSTTGPIRLFDWPTTEAEFVDVEQCAWLGYPIDYYLKGGS